MPKTRLRAGWREEIDGRIGDLHARTNVVAARKLPDGPERARVAAVRGLLDKADDTIRRRQSLRGWWTGSTIDSAWDLVHRAELGLVGVSAEEELYGTVTPLQRWMRHVLPAVEAKAWGERLSAWREPAEVERGVLRQAYGDVIVANRDWHASLRAFRNLIVAVAAGLTLLLVVLSAWHLLNTSIVPLCHPADAQDPGCFGGSSPGKSLIEVELVGMLGGLLSSAFLLARARKPPSRYSVLLPQVVLKAVSGAAAALVGVLLLQSGLVVLPGTEESSTLVLLVYAFTFGFSQQLLTQLIDRHSETLLAPPARPSAELRER